MLSQLLLMNIKNQTKAFSSSFKPATENPAALNGNLNCDVSGQSKVREKSIRIQSLYKYGMQENDRQRNLKVLILTMNTSTCGSAETISIVLDNNITVIALTDKETRIMSVHTILVPGYNWCIYNCLTIIAMTRIYVWLTWSAEARPEGPHRQPN